MNSVPSRDGEPPPPSSAPRPLLSVPSSLAPPEDGVEEGSLQPPTPGRSRSPGHSPARKRMKLDLTGLSPSARVKRVCEHRLTRLRQVSTACRENMTELFFLSKKRNLIDLPGFRKKPSPEFVNFLKEKKAPERVISEVHTAVLGNMMQATPVEPRRHIYSPRVTMLSPVKVGQQQDAYNARAPPLPPVSRTLPPLPPPCAPSYTADQLQEKVRQEGWVIRRVAELSRDGLWPANRLPKVVEQPRPLAAWDMVLQEMKWMAADFQQERLWKQSAARVQAAAVKQFVAEKQRRDEAEKLELENRLTQRRIAHSLATQVKCYWKHVCDLHRYEVGQRHSLYLSNQLATQLGHVTELQESLTYLNTNSTKSSSLPVTHNNSSRKRKLETAITSISSPSPVITSVSQSISSEASPEITSANDDTTSDSQGPLENGLSACNSSLPSSASPSDDEESTIEEQEAYELANCVIDGEIEMLAADARKELALLLRENYPGALTDYLSRPVAVLDDDSCYTDDEGSSSYWQSNNLDSDDSESEMDNGDVSTPAPSHKVYSLHGLLPLENNKDRTRSNSGGGAASVVSASTTPVNSSDVKTNGDLTRKDLIELSETAETHLPKSVINLNGTGGRKEVTSLFKGRLREYQAVAVKWLRTMYEAGLPAVLADESGLGRKVVTAAFISNLVNSSLQSKGPHILIVPSSTLHAWKRTFTRFTPGLRCTVLTPSCIMPRSQLHDLLISHDDESSRQPHVLLTTYRTFFQFPGVLTSTRWDLVLLAEVQNLVAAGSPDQLRALAALTSLHRILIMTGPQKENPIDLWNVVHLLFPGVAQESGHQTPAMVEGTVMYTETVRKLQRLVSSFTIARSRTKHPLLEKQLPGVNQVPLYVNLNSRQKELYDDYLAKPNTQEMIKSGDLNCVSSMVQHLRNICNHSDSLVYPPSEPSFFSRTPSDVSPEPPRALSRLLQVSPLDSVSMDNMNLVFLKQELSTTVLTSARLRSLKASRELIQELSSTSTPSSSNPTPSNTSNSGAAVVAQNSKLFPPRVPTGKLTFSLEAITRTVNGWNVPGGWVEGMGLVRAVSGQVFKVCANPVGQEQGETSAAASSGDTNKPLIPSSSNSDQHIIHSESLKSIAEINHWRCSGFPLYGQDLIRSLEITNSIRPARSRFCGQGYINCLTESHRQAAAGSSHLVVERDDWRFRTDRLAGLLEVGGNSVEKVQRGIRTLHTLERDPTFNSPKLQALCGILDERYRNRERVIVILNSNQVLPIFKQFIAWKSFRSLIVSGESSMKEQRNLLDKFRLESRFMLLILVGIQTFAGLDIPQVETVVEYDWTPLSSDLISKGLDFTPNTVFRLICRGTLEESTSRRSLQRRIYSELEANTDTPTIKKQTLEELFRPASDNGFFYSSDKKKKDKCKEDDEESLSQVLSLLGLPCSDQSNTLLDLAELDTVDQPDTDQLDSSLDQSYEDPDLMAWIENIPPIQRYGMKQLAESSEFWDVEWQTEDFIVKDSQNNNEKIKLSIEEDIFKRGQKRKLEEESIEYVTYPSVLVNREWRDKEGELPFWKAPCHVDVQDDCVTKLLYKSTPMPEEDLPPVHVKKEIKMENSLGSGLSNSIVSSPATSMPASPIDKPKIKREECITAAPRSIFDRPKQFKAMPRPRAIAGMGPTPGASTINNSVNFMSANNALVANQVQGGMAATNAGLVNNLMVGGKPGLVGGATAAPQDIGPEWLIQEDWALHQAVLSLQEMPLNLNQVSPAHIINWDLVADIVNAVSRCYRSLRQCRSRYEAIIQPREEGKILYNDITPTKKQKKTKLNLKGGQIQPAEKKPISKPMKTSTLFKQDNNNAWSTQFASRFETIKAIANKRTPTTKPVLVNSTQRNPKHASVLAEFNINYDNPLGPAQVAANKAERLQKDKLRAQQQAQLAAASQPQQQQVQQVQQQQQIVAAGGHQQRIGVTSVPIPTQVQVQQQQVVGNAAAVASSNSNLPQAVVVSISQPIQQQQVLSTVGQISTVSRPIVTQAVVTVSGVLSGLQQSGTLTRLAGGQIIVSQAGGKAVAAGQAPAGSTLVAGRALTQAQIKVLQAQSMQKQLHKQRQMQLQQQQQQQQQQQSGVTGVNTVQTTSPLVTTALVGGVSTATARTVPGTSGIGRGHIVRPTNFDLKQMIAKQQLKVTGPGIVQVQPGSLNSAQLQQLGIQVATTPGVQGTTALVKAVPNSIQNSIAGATQGTAQVSGVNVLSGNLQPGTKSVTIPIAAGAVNLQPGQQLKAVAAAGGRVGVTTVVTAPVVSGQGTVTANIVAAGTQQGSQQQIQQWRQLMMRKGVQPKVALQQVGGKLPTQLIVHGAGGQPGGKGLPATVTVQQLQQIVKNATGGGQGSTVQIGSVAQGQQLLSHTVLAKPGGAPGQTVQARVIPASVAGGRGQQTIQVVAAGPHVQRAGAGVPNVTLDALSRQQGGTASAIASALAAGNPVKIAASGGATQQQILSQVTAALAGQVGQPVSVAVRTQPISSSNAVMTSQQLTARTINTSVGGGTTTLVVNQPSQQITVPVQQQNQQLVTSQQLISNQPQQLISSQQQMMTTNQHQMVSSQQQLITSQGHQIVSSQPQIISSQQQLITSQPQQIVQQTQQIVQQQQQQIMQQPQQMVQQQQQQMVQQPQQMVQQSQQMVQQPQQQIVQQHQLVVSQQHHVVTSQHQLLQQQNQQSSAATAVQGIQQNQINPQIQSSESS